MPPFITILVCTRDRNESLARCVESLLRLHYEAFEIVVVDNGSRAFVVPDLNYSRRTSFYRKPVPGLSLSRNLVLPHLKGEWIALIDDDAIADPNWLQCAARFFEEAGCITGRILRLDQQNKWQAKLLASGWFPSSTELKVFDSKNYNPFRTLLGAGSNIIVRKNILEREPFPELFGPGTPSYAADEHYLFSRIISLGWKIVYQPESIIYHDFAPDEIDYAAVLRKGAISRGGYLTKFLFTERGYRFAAMRHICSALFTGENQTQGPRTPRNSVWLGPSALLRSAMAAPQKRKQARLELIAQKGSA
jgi:glycosyltransferase involved in cell wall biosynthesis